ncbi:MAG TPA: M36 family metallopeptidase, partial [Pyrinomonadaceae bacterium]|nr:M36 family metallopeptidase [Pyrinomonadaceae bacterium]
MKPLYAVLVLAVVAALSFDHNAPVEARNQTPFFDNYDIRDDNTAVTKLRGPRQQRQRAVGSGFKIEYNEALDIAEVISSDQTLAPAGRARTDVLRNFVAANSDIFGLTSLDQLKQTADYRNPDGNLAFVRFEQQLNGIPIFGAELKGGFTKRDELFRVINNLAPDLNEASTDFGYAGVAIAAAPQHIGNTKIETSSAERFYFPVGNGIALPSWRVHLETADGGSYYVIVDSNGMLLWRKNLVEQQAAPATYNPYITTDYLMSTADSPSPFSPGCLAPTGCAQPPAIARTSVTRIGNEAPYTFNNLGWIPDTGLPVRTPADPNITDGNNVETGIDRDGTQGVDNNGWAFGSPTRVFNYAFNPAPGLPPPGEAPLPATQTYPPSPFQQGAITHGFYLINRWHDEMYRFGFNEQAQNFQHFNFGRGGAEGDRISFEIQDSSGTNSSNIAITADGSRPRLQAFIWTGPTPDRDGALDSQMVIHEVTHGLSGRLIGNATGLSSNMSRGMGEGWSDFYAFALLSELGDSPLGTHALSAYASYQVTPGFDSNYYYGLRRFPVAVLRSRGPNGLSHNPLTFRYINAGCDTLIGTTVTNPNSAYPRNPVFSTAGTCDQVHNIGEVWAVALWEVRDQLIQRHSGAEGNRRAIQYITDAMKLSPLNPTILQMRDAIIAAVNVSDANDLQYVYRGFAIRGMGHGAAITNPGTGANNTVVTESFLMPPQFRRPARADFDGDARTDISVFRPSDRVWYLNRSTTGFAAMIWGLSTDQPVPDDYDGDGKTDITVFRATADGALPDFYIFRSTDSTITYISWGTTADVAISEDYDGDNKADVAIYRPSTGVFWVRRSTDGGTLISGPMTGSPLAIDYNGDGYADFATFNNGSWRIAGNGPGFGLALNAIFGMAGDKAVPADYDGDGRDDLAVYRPSDGTWYIVSPLGGGLR